MPGCCVPQCTNHSRNGWKLYRFPKDPKRRLLWTVKIKRYKWQATNTSYVCSAHFEENNYEQHRADGWKKLKPNAVPTLFTFKPLPKQRKPPKERTVPSPSSKETNKSPPGLRQSPAAVEATLETPENHAIPESTRHGTSCYGQDAMEVGDAVIELSANTSDADSREVNAATGETALKEYVSDGGNLSYPSKGVMKALIDYEEHFTAINSWCTDKIVTMNSPLRSLTAYLSKVRRHSLSVCAEHEDGIYRLLIERYARMRLRIHLRQVPVGSSNGHGSKTCAGVNLA
ncbi:uncharacterized protein LOC144168259 [Haemaphysalis longicornis]